ncbi:hypothetical protein RhiirC2_721802, partial [Rhizophagus irregularis]
SLIPPDCGINFQSEQEIFINKKRNDDEFEDGAEFENGADFENGEDEVDEDEEEEDGDGDGDSLLHTLFDDPGIPYFCTYGCASVKKGEIYLKTKFEIFGLYCVNHQCTLFSLNIVCR